MVKKIGIVTILFCLIVGAFVVTSYAADPLSVSPFTEQLNSSNVYSYGYSYYLDLSNENLFKCVFTGTFDTIYANCYIEGNGMWKYVVASETPLTNIRIYFCPNVNSSLVSSSNFNVSTVYNGVFYYKVNSLGYSSNISCLFPVEESFEDCVNAIDLYLNPPAPPAPVYTKNPNVDAFLANTIISMGVTFESASDALSVASDCWDYIINDENMDPGRPSHKSWDIDYCVSYSNAQSNNYLDWYNGYKIPEDLAKAIHYFIVDNKSASTSLSPHSATLDGVSVTYDPRYNYISSSNMAFYAASTVTYVNGAYLHDSNVIDSSQFLYTPADVRKFIGFPTAGTIVIPLDPDAGTGELVDGNGDKVYDIDINFPSLDWLADALQSLLDFIRQGLSTLADLLTQLLDAILGLFSDAFASLTEFGQGILDWISALVTAFVNLGSGYIPSDLWSVIVPFIYLSIGIGILKFILKAV